MSHIRTTADEQALKDDFYFDDKEADRALRFFSSSLTIKGKPFQPTEWQKQVISDLHGWKRKDGTFRFRKGYISTAKKNGKTELNSGICLLHLLGGYEHRPLVGAVANTVRQASQVWDNIEYYATNNQKIRDVTSPTPSSRTLKYPREQGRLEILSNDVKGKYGTSYSCLSFDEICLAPNSKLFNALQYASISRDQPLHIACSTAGYDCTDNNPGWRLYQYAKQIIAGTNLDPEFYAAIWEVDETMDLDDPDIWRLANPALGVTQSEETFRKDWAKAQKNTAELLEFIRFRFNCWTKTKQQWIALSDYDSCAGSFPELGRTPVYLGLDLASTFDLCSLGMVSAPLDNKYYVQNWNWSTSVAVEKRVKSQLLNYDQFRREGFLTICDGNQIEHSKVRAKILELAAKYNVQGVVVESWNHIGIVEQLRSDGLNVIDFAPSTARYNAPTRQFEQLIREKNLVIEGNNSLLRWALQNCGLAFDGNDNCKPQRNGAESEKIDPVISVILALSAAMLSISQYRPQLKSVYDDPNYKFIVV